MDLSSLVESIRRSFGEIPPTAITIALLAGPTLALIGYRLISVARRVRSSNETALALWVCPDCRSVNELRLAHCYRCGLAGDATDEVEIFVDAPAGPRVPFEVPAGSPFATLASGQRTNPDPGVGLPVMADRSTGSDAVAVGPGRVVEKRRAGGGGNRVVTLASRRPRPKP